jgi:hypothetical protein
MSHKRPADTIYKNLPRVWHCEFMSGTVNQVEEIK